MANKLRWADESDEHSVHYDERRAREETRAILLRASALWASSSCPGSAECCHAAVSKRPPWLWPTEWLHLARSLERAGRAIPPPRPDGACRLLDVAGLRCTVYADRPFGCRTYFCHRRVGPNEPAAATHALLDELKAVNVALDFDATPKTLDDWLTQAFDE